MNKFKKVQKIFLLVFVLLFSLSLFGCGKNNDTLYSAPIIGWHGFWDIFVYPVAGIMWVFGKITGGNYFIVLILSTLLVRTIAWPVYAKTNDMSLKMQLAQPELDKLQLKYGDKEDEQSKQRMQMETMQIYKKYGIGIGGCVMPLIQLPIFMGFYQAVSRVPFTIKESGTWLANAITKTSIFGIDLTLTVSDQGAAKGMKIFIYILAGLVGATQILSILINNRRQKKQKEQQNANIPEYRRPQQSDQQKQTTGMMNFMMYGMAAMMVFFVIQRPAGMGIYWLIGNVYSILQTAIGQKNTQKRLSKLKVKANGGR